MNPFILVITWFLLYMDNCRWRRTSSMILHSLMLTRRATLRTTSDCWGFVRVGGVRTYDNTLWFGSVAVPEDPSIPLMAKKNREASRWDITGPHWRWSDPLQACFLISMFQHCAASAATTGTTFVLVCDVVVMSSIIRSFGASHLRFVPSYGLFFKSERRK